MRVDTCAMSVVRTPSLDFSRLTSACLRSIFRSTFAALPVWPGGDQGQAGPHGEGREGQEDEQGDAGADHR